MLNNELREREKQEALDEIQTVIPPDDIVAFNESRSCADLFRLYQRGQMDIRPKFQRGIVWTNREQSLFVDSLIKQLPIPSLCISLDIKSQKRLVIDGLQRLWTIIKFLNYKTDDWKLSKTEEVDLRISNKKVSEIVKDTPILFDKLENLTIPITVLRCEYDKTNHMDYLFQIFRRLNSGGSKLLNQEIRNCIYEGVFNDFLREIVLIDEWLNFVKTDKEKSEKSRFGNEERVLRFFAMYDSYEKYTGNLAQFLNKYMEKMRNEEKIISQYRSLLIRSLKVLSKVKIPEAIQKNKNLLEGILVGVAKNINKLEFESENEIADKFENLLQTAPYTDDIREGMAHTNKVKERIEASIQEWGK